MKMLLQRIIRKWVRNAGFQRRIAPDFVDVMDAQGIDVVLDVGANDGDYGREIRDRGYNGLIVSFEPNPVAFARLIKDVEKDANWVAYPEGVGEVDGEAELSIASNDTMSSFKGLTQFGENTGAKPVDKVAVNITRLDTFLSNHPEYLRSTYLKIDTQGFESEVINGTGEKLNLIKAVQAEVALVHTYEGEQDWIAFLLDMRDRGFEVATSVCNSRIAAQVREFDFVFTNKKLQD